MPDTTKNLDPIGFRYKQTSETNEFIDIYRYLSLFHFTLYFGKIQYTQRWSNSIEDNALGMYPNIVHLNMTSLAAVLVLNSKNQRYINSK